jgi:hypothetical protein
VAIVASQPQVTARLFDALAARDYRAIGEHAYLELEGDRIQTTNLVCSGQRPIA